MIPYKPIDCGFHDQLEDFAIRRVPVEIILVPNDGDAPGHHSVSGQIADVFARDGADWMTVNTGSDQSVTIRLDRIQSVNGIPLSTSC